MTDISAPYRLFIDADGEFVILEADSYWCNKASYGGEFWFSGESHDSPTLVGKTRDNSVINSRRFEKWDSESFNHSILSTIGFTDLWQYTKSIPFTQEELDRLINLIDDLRRAETL